MVHQIHQNSKQVMESMSDIVWAMNAGTEKGASIEGRIKNYGYELLAQKNIMCDYTIDSQAEKIIQQPEARKNILLIVKEGLNNLAKYCDATQASVRILHDSSVICIHVGDNGRGFDTAKVNTGNGLRNMQQRTEAIGGTFGVFSAEGQGTRIECTFPVTNISDV